MIEIRAKKMSDDYKIFKVCLLASKNVGKETLANIFTKVSDRLAIGVEWFVKSVVINGNKQIKIQLWVNTNREYKNKDGFKLLWNTYLQGTNSIIIMYDITNAETVNILTEWCEVIRKNTKEVIPILLVGNKLDLEEIREVSKELVEKLKEENNISESIEISLQTGENVEKMFLKLTEMAIKEKIDKDDFSLDPIEFQESGAVRYGREYIPSEITKIMDEEFVNVKTPLWCVLLGFSVIFIYILGVILTR